ncbi:MAG: HU family DNA-binding protein [Pseudomonadota bacterium]|nr:HU family DNA-binding protein [Pseudomonadota bacterium]
MESYKTSLPLNKSEFISKLSQKFNSFTFSDIDFSVKKIFEYISQSLYSGERVELRGFGTFSLHEHNSRTARNPKTGEPVALQKRYTVHFKPSKELKRRVNNK